MKIILVLSFVFVAHESFSQVVATRQTTICRLAKTVRTIRIEKLKDGRFQTVYTKSGEDKVIGSGLNPDSCQRFLEDLKQTLIKAKWICRDHLNPGSSLISEEKR